MFGARLAKLRKQRGWNQAELAARVSVSPSAIGMYEQGRREPDCATLAALARVLDTSTDYLLTGREPFPDATVLFSKFEELLAQAQSCMTLTAPDGTVHPFGREELAMLLCAIDAAQREARAGGNAVQNEQDALLAQRRKTKAEIDEGGAF